VRTILAFMVVLTLTGCAGSGSGGGSGSLTPINWFGGGASARPETLAPRGGFPVAVDRRPLIEKITAVAVERTPYGIIVRATGLSPTLGYFDAGLVPVAAPRRGEMAFEFRARPPGRAMPTGTAYARQITAGAFIPGERLHGIRTIRVIGTTNSRTARR